MLNCILKGNNFAYILHVKYMHIINKNINSYIKESTTNLFKNSKYPKNINRQIKI